MKDKWIVTKIGDIVTHIHYGYTAVACKEKIGPKYLRITDIQDNSVIWNNVPYCAVEESKKGKYQLREGDLVFVRTGATVGKSYLIRGDIPDSIFASYLIRINLGSGINSKYVYYFFQSFIYWLQIHKGKIGIGQPNFNAQKLSQIEIPMAPESQQIRIVEKIEELFSKLDAGIEALKKAKEELKRYRQAILKYAFEGKLTKEWRNKYDVKNNWANLKFIKVVSNEKNAIKRGPFGSSVKKSFFVEKGFKVYEQQNAIYDDVKLGHYYITEDKYAKSAHDDHLFRSMATT